MTTFIFKLHNLIYSVYNLWKTITFIKYTKCENILSQEKVFWNMGETDIMHSIKFKICLIFQGPSELRPALRWVGPQHGEPGADSQVFPLPGSYPEAGGAKSAAVCPRHRGPVRGQLPEGPPGCCCSPGFDAALTANRTYTSNTGIPSGLLWGCGGAGWLGPGRRWRGPCGGGPIGRASARPTAGAGPGPPQGSQTTRRHQDLHRRSR